MLKNRNVSARRPAMVMASHDPSGETTDSRGFTRMGLDERHGFQDPLFAARQFSPENRRVIRVYPSSSVVETSVLPWIRSRFRRSVAALLISLIIPAWVVTGCHSPSPSQYISPRVEGRVLDAQTRQPISGVMVRRLDPSRAGGAGEVIKGGQVLERAPFVRTAPDGAFAVASERDLELFLRSGWYAVTLSFEHAGYLAFTTNYTVANATLTTGGEPLVRAGDIRLVPRAK